MFICFSFNYFKSFSISYMILPFATAFLDLNLKKMKHEKDTQFCLLK